MTFPFFVNYTLCEDVFHSDIGLANQCPDMKWVAWYQPVHAGQGLPLEQEEKKSIE